MTFADIAGEDGWASLAELGGKLRQLDPSFDPRTYGKKQLSQLITSFPEEFETKEKSNRGGKMAVKLK